MRFYVFFLSSLLFGSDGSYNILGTSVTFQNEDSPYPSSFLEGADLISALAIKCLNSGIFRWVTQGYTHVFIHEMGHALAYKLLTGQNARIRIIPNICVGITTVPQSTSDWKSSIVDVSAPMGDIAFSTCKLVAATALKNYLSWPVRLALGGGAVAWISGELLLAFVSVCSKQVSDFGNLANRGNIHLGLATAAIITQTALGIFAAIKLSA